MWSDPKISPLRGAKNRRKTSFLGVSEQVRTTKFFGFRPENFVAKQKEPLVAVSNCFTGIGMRLYYSQNLSTSRIGAVPEVFTGVGTRFYHSQKVFTSSIGAVPDVFTRVGTRRYHSQNVFTCCIGAVPGVFTRVGTRLYYSQN